MSRLLLLAGQAGAGKSTVEGLLRDITPTKSLGMADPLKAFAADVFQFSHSQLWGPSSARNAYDPRWSSRSFWTDAEFRVRHIYGPDFVGKLLMPAAQVKYGRDYCLNTLMDWVEGEKQHALSSRSLTARRILQTLGTEYARKTFGDDVWVNLAIESFEPGSKSLRVITDGRFPNEIAAVKAAGGKVWLIRGGASRPLDEKSHASERGLQGLPEATFDFVIDNPCPLPGDETINFLRASVREGLHQAMIPHRR